MSDDPVEPNRPESRRRSAACSGCGRTADSAAAIWWTHGTRPDGTPTALCPDCARREARNIEAGLDEQWW